MLTAKGDQVAHLEPSLATTTLDDGPQELSALREADGVELTAGVELGRHDLLQIKQLVADVLHLLVRFAEEGRSSDRGAEVSEAKQLKRRAESTH